MKEEVREGYEKGDYESEYREGRDIRNEELELFNKLFELIDGAEVLDLGCGTGVPFDLFLAENDYHVTGVDIAENHVQKARENLPEGKFIRENFFDLEMDSASFDAIVSFYAIFHIPREEHLELLQKMNAWLKKDGSILITMGAAEMDMMQGDIGGEEMLWSSYSSEKNLEIVEEAGFEVIKSYQEDWREEDHLWILAKPK
jgi:cyclopropane fatty-acyl-phospholipid synthase-like methyltransferase